MKKLSIAGLFLIIVMSAFAPSDEKGNQTNFQAGEKIVYKLFYNWNFVWLSAGEVTFEVKDEGEEYHIEVTGVTSSLFPRMPPKSDGCRVFTRPARMEG